MRHNKVLWTVQAVLAALFLFAGSMKLILPIEAMAAPVALPGPFLRFLGVAEVAGAIGLILPGLVRVHRELTSAAAAGLVVIMTGATIITLASTGALAALFPLLVGLLVGTVAYGRWAPASRFERLALQ